MGKGRRAERDGFFIRQNSTLLMARIAPWRKRRFGLLAEYYRETFWGYQTEIAYVKNVVPFKDYATRLSGLSLKELKQAFRVLSAEQALKADFWQAAFQEALWREFELLPEAAQGIVLHYVKKLVEGSPPSVQCHIAQSAEADETSAINSAIQFGFSTALTTHFSGFYRCLLRGRFCAESPV